ncbi:MULTISPECIES: Hpt domain-containing protein [unclassified Aureimonas]|uniref:Hpt domain-containing protein n=1 Tax=unclassified Aureimonas TaxID=2615206 RepID=UPI0006F8F2E6|nr:MULTISPECIES: Hpt domain-containing protein [unclassified Aureimonas]KQT57407.1 hypothetical protein ASG62_08770 [Aureimonas sp. Leaf427]KQT77086.1 hypothetical protein ASG54_12635 [Aureimonas sp. Leaf460]
MARTSSLRREPAFSSDVAVCSSHGRPVDLVHLSHQTMGDTGLEREILGLLARQISTFAGRLDSATPTERGRVAHALKGAALNVGAFLLARSAESLEHAPACPDALAGFERDLAVTGAFIADILRDPSTAH